MKILQDDNSGRIELFRKQLGVVASITPWNGPLMIAVWHILPALRTGNTVVIKVIVVTDATCLWANDISDLFLVLPGTQGPLRDGASALIAVLDMLIANVIVLLGHSVNERVDRLTDLQDIFGDFED